jgi:hypothetical protein
MRKILLISFVVASISIAMIAVPTIGQAQMMGGYGGYGYGMMGGYGGGYGPGYMMGPGYGGGYGPGMMYGDGPNGERYYGRGSQSYRGKRLCWHQTDARYTEGYYEPCPN